MNTLFQNILTASFHGSIVILAVMVLRLALKKTPKKFICLLWLLAGVRLLMPFELQSRLSLQPQPETARQGWHEEMRREAQPDGGQDLPYVTGDVPQVPQGQIAPAPSAADADPAPLPTQAGQAGAPAPVEDVPSQPREAPGLAELLPYIWLAVACCFAVYSIYSYVRLRMQVREAIKIPGGWECEHIETAFILGFIRPKIYIPMGMSPYVRKYILAHERTHLEKGDHWFKMIGYLALALHWFNPLVWVAYILLCKDIEMACDERVVQFMELSERKAYSAALLNCSTNRAHLTACPVAFGEVSVKYRIKSVLNYRKPSFWISLLGVVAIVFVAVCLVPSPAGEQTPGTTEGETLSAQAEVVQRVDGKLQAYLEQEQFYIEVNEITKDGSVIWGASYYRDGENTLWRSTDHLNEEGYLVLDGTPYELVKGKWVQTEPWEEDPAELCQRFFQEGKDLYAVEEQTKTSDFGNTYRELTFTAQWNADGETRVQPVKVLFDGTGEELERIRLEDDTLKGADYLTLALKKTSAEDIREAFADARQNIADASEVGFIEAPTEDSRRIKEWGVNFVMDDDVLTARSGEAWFVQKDGYDMPVTTDKAYWLEKQTDSGWEKLPTLVQDIQWPEDTYVLGKGMYTISPTDWKELYGDLPGGTYRMGKTFTNMANGASATGYAEFTIYANSASTEEQTAAVERCYAALEKLKASKTLHWRSTSSWEEEVWYNDGNYLMIRTFLDNAWEGRNNGRVDIAARWDGVGYEGVHEDREDWRSRIVGMRLSTLKADRAGGGVSFADDLNLFFFERSNKAITFPDGVGVVSDKMVRFCQTWEVKGMAEGSASAQLTYRFDEAGNLVYMEYEPLYEDALFNESIAILDNSAEEIDAKIRPYTQNLTVEPFSWEGAKAKYTGGEFNIREDQFVNNSAAPVSDPVEAARRALREYPNLGEYLDLDVCHDDGAGMWKVTVRSYVDYQSTYAFRDIYLDDNGVTKLLVYEGPIRFDETRK